MPAVMLRRDWPGPFQRTIKPDPANKSTWTTLYFQPGAPVDLDAATIDLLKDDIGKALLPVAFDEKGRPRILEPGEWEVDESPEADPAPAAETTEPAADGEPGADDDSGQKRKRKS